VILLDTHIWVWWIQTDERLTDKQRYWLKKHQPGGLGVSVISCWEVAKLAEYNRLELSYPIAEWMDYALVQPGIRLLDLTPRIAVESTRLPGTFHRDPADQIIVATARLYDCPLLTVDAKILNYPHVKTLPLPDHESQA